MHINYINNMIIIINIVPEIQDVISIFHIRGGGVARAAEIICAWFRVKPTHIIIRGSVVDLLWKAEIEFPILAMVGLWKHLIEYSIQIDKNEN